MQTDNFAFLQESFPVH